MRGPFFFFANRRETKIVVRFWIVTAILCAVGFALFYYDFTFFRR